jgi:dTDP-4-amino-4,6-dideoxygalactose transaminase
MQVPLLDLQALHQPLRQPLVQALERVVDSGQFIGGPEVEAFETELAHYCGVAHAVAMSSGTDALLALLMSLDLEPGAEVITTPFSFVATSGCLARLGLKAVYVDIDPSTYNIDAEAVARAVGANTAGILCASLFGQCANLSRLEDIAQAAGVWLIDDAAQALGAEHYGQRSGQIGLAATTSFFPAKNLGGIGDGGAVMCSDPELAERLRHIRNHGAARPYSHDLLGGNFRLDALQAAALRVKLPYLDSWLEQRRAQAHRYDQALARHSWISAPRTAPGNWHSYNQYVVRVPETRRDELRNLLSRRGIATAVYYPSGLHEQPCFKHWGYHTGDFPHTELASREVLALPLLGIDCDAVIAALQEA